MTQFGVISNTQLLLFYALKLPCVEKSQSLRYKVIKAVQNRKRFLFVPHWNDAGREMLFYLLLIQQKNCRPFMQFRYFHLPFPDAFCLNKLIFRGQIAGNA